MSARDSIREMRPYAIQVVGPAGRVTYLQGTVEIENLAQASRYASPQEAWLAADTYDKLAHATWILPPVVMVIDAEDPENTVPDE